MISPKDRKYLTALNQLKNKATLTESQTREKLITYLIDTIKDSPAKYFTDIEQMIIKSCQLAGVTKREDIHELTYELIDKSQPLNDIYNGRIKITAIK